MRTLLFLLTLTAVAWLHPVSGHAQALVRNGDVFELRLSGMPSEFASEFALQYTVGDDGEVSIPQLNGQIKATGLSTTQLARNIEKRLIAEKIFTNPTAVINLQNTSRAVTIGGAVRAPQAVMWSPDMTLSVAITRAGGKGEFAKDKAKITREGKTWTVDLRKKEKDPNQNPKLLPGDEVQVLE